MKYILALSIFLLATGCNSLTKKTDQSDVLQASKVELRNNEGKYRLYVNGEEFYILGAGLEHGDIKTLAEHGANSFRTWGIDNGRNTGKEVLDMAYENNLMVLMGIDVKKERHGFDYNDSLWVSEQLEEIKNDVISLKDHPALLGWGIGNELNLEYSNLKVWDAVQEIAAMIHEVDGNHPTTTMLAGIQKKEVDYIGENCPDIDFLSIQMYGDIPNIRERIKTAGYSGPYVISEWGAVGHWEVGKTEWGAPIEQTSSEKADFISRCYTDAIFSEENTCLGSYVFLWGQKQERTPTWYGLITEMGEYTEPIDRMYEFWNGKKPDNSSPRLISQKLNGKERSENIYLEANKEYSVDIEVSDPDGDSLSAQVEILLESTDLKKGGDRESRPGSVKGLILDAQPEKILFKAPAEKGQFRIFVYITDGNNHCATVNFPFMVR